MRPRRHHRHQFLRRPAYGNWKVYGPEGQLLFRCDDKKANWYLSRNLANIVKDKEIKLSFVPAGPGHQDDPFYLSERPNHCVVCGSKEYLTKHHCVPSQFRRFFPTEYKQWSSHDVLPICSDCHFVYEVEADKLKKQLAIEFGVKSHFEPKLDLDLVSAIKSAKALIRHGENIPEDRKLHLREAISKFLGREATDSDIQEVASLSHKDASKPNEHTFGEYVVKQLDQVQLFEFIKRWRQHFIDIMKPKFMHKYWDVNHIPRRLRELKSNEKGSSQIVRE